MPCPRSGVTVANLSSIPPSKPMYVNYDNSVCNDSDRRAGNLHMGV